MEYTKDIINGKQVITKLNVEELEKGIYEFYFKPLENILGQPLLVPVTVIKNSNSKKFLLNSGVHGDELNPILTAHKVKNELVNLGLEKIDGTITIVHGFNNTGLLNNSRGYKTSGRFYDFKDLNRQMTVNKETPMEANEQYSYNMWNNLIINNTDYNIDLHTGNKFPLFVFADCKKQIIKDIVNTLGVDILKIDDGEPGSLETSLMENDIPSVTLELGGASIYEKDIVDRATEGVLNAMKLLKFVEGEVVEMKPKETGSEYAKVIAKHGGFVEIDVKLVDKVEKGDILGRQYGPFGEVVEEFVAPESGVITVIQDYPLCEPGDTVIKIIMN